MYDFVIAQNEAEIKSYIKYIYDRYNAEAISVLLKNIVDKIEAEILNISVQDYQPYGASTMVLMSDLKSNQQIHLDKSHICAHTYPDFQDPEGVLSFRIDINISTCGEISPLTALNLIFDFFDTDVVIIDYMVRGFTRDIDGKRVYMDHSMNSIKDFIKSDILQDYAFKDLILQSENIWQLRLLRTNMQQDEYFMDEKLYSLENQDECIQLVRNEMLAIFNNWKD